MIYNIKNKNTFFSPGETDIVIPSSGEVVAPSTDSEKSVILPYTSSKAKRKKRNLVSSMGPLIIKVTETKEIEYEEEGETIKKVIPYKINKSYNDILDAFLNDQKIKILYKEKELLDIGTNIFLNIKLLEDPSFAIMQISKYQFYGVSFGSSLYQFIASSPDEPMVFQNAIQDELQELINEDRPTPTFEDLSGGIASPDDPDPKMT